MQENSSLPNFTECVTKQKNVLTSLLGYQSSPFFVSRFFKNLKTIPNHFFFFNSTRTAQQNTFSYSISSSVFQLFPNEIILSIANFLDCQSICRLGQTCRKMIFLLEEETLWKNLFKKYWNSLPRKENLYFNRWKLTFQKRYVLEKNWDHARCVLIPLTPQHNLAIRDIQIFESLAVTGSGDKSVKLWNLDTHQNIANFSGSAGVGGLYLTDSFLISG